MDQVSKALRRAVVFDIETVGAVNDENRAAIEPLAKKRQQNPEEYTGLCPPLARVACIAWYDTGSQSGAAAYDASLAPPEAATTTSLEIPSLVAGNEALNCPLTACPSERDLIDTFARVVDEHLANGKTCVVSYNGRNFDLPVLIHRGIVSGANRIATFLKLVRENRYNAVQHIDLLEVVTFNGVAGRWPLAAYVIGYGARSPKDEMDGAQVGEAVRGGRIIDVVRYCANDVLATSLLYARCAPLLPADKK